MDNSIHAAFFKRVARLTGFSPKSTLLLSIALAGLFLFSFSAAGELTVCPNGCQFCSLQRAIDQAGTGEKIIVRAGIYRENLIINKELTIEGFEGEPVEIRGANKGYPALFIGPSSEAVTIENLKISQADESGITLTGEVDLNLSRVSITENRRHGIQMVDSSQATVRKSSITANGWGGVELFDSSSISLIGCSIRGNGWGGVELSDSSRAIVSSSLIEGNVDGVSVWEEGRVSLSGCRVTEHVRGVFLKDKAEADLEDNKIAENRHGVTLFVQGCGPNKGPTPKQFAGQIEGSANIFANNFSSLCPSEDLAFLKTDNGGRFPPRA